MLDDNTFHVDGMLEGVDAVVSLRIVGDTIMVFRNRRHTDKIVFLTVEN